MSSIKLSPEHGVNPVIPNCFWCGQKKNEIAMLGKIDRQDSKAPENIVLNYEPCDKCNELFSQGIQVIGVTETPAVKDMFPIQKSDSVALYPTGNFIVVGEDWAKAVFADDEETLKNVLEYKRLLMDDDCVVEMIKQAKSEDNEVVENESND